MNRYTVEYIRSFIDLTSCDSAGNSNSEGNNPTISTAADFIATDKNKPATIDVLANDDTGLTVSSVTTPQNGIATIDNNNITYTPNNNFVGSDMFTYTVTDTDGATATQIVYTYTIETDNTCRVYKALIVFNSENQPVAIVEHGNIKTSVKNNSGNDITLRTENQNRSIVLQPEQIYSLTCKDIPYLDGSIPPPFTVIADSLPYGVTIHDDDKAEVINNTGGDIYVIEQ